MIGKKLQKIFKIIKKYQRRVLIHVWFIAAVLGAFYSAILIGHADAMIYFISMPIFFFGVLNATYIIWFVYLFGRTEEFCKGGFEVKVNDDIILYITSYKISVYKSAIMGKLYINARVDMKRKDKYYGDICVLIPATEYLIGEYTKFIENRYKYSHSKSNEIFLKIITAATIKVCKKYYLLT